MNYQSQMWIKEEGQHLEGHPVIKTLSSLIMWILIKDLSPTRGQRRSQWLVEAYLWWGCLTLLGIMSAGSYKVASLATDKCILAYSLSYLQWKSYSLSIPLGRYSANTQRANHSFPEDILLMAIWLAVVIP